MWVVSDCLAVQNVGGCQLSDNSDLNSIFILFLLTPDRSASADQYDITQGLCMEVV